MIGCTLMPPFMACESAAHTDRATHTG
jgi:hypothetical protein